MSDYRGKNNSLQEDSEGIQLIISFDEDLKPVYQEFCKLGDKIKTIPVELYKIEFFDFAWNEIKYRNRKAACLFVDPTSLHPTSSKNKVTIQV